MIEAGTKTLVKRWVEKAEKYDELNLEESFDKFFSLYVAYNALYFEGTKYLNKEHKKRLDELVNVNVKKEELVKCLERKKKVSRCLKKYDIEVSNHFDNFKDTGDRVSAIKNMSVYIGHEILCTEFIKYKENIEKIIDLNEKNTFYFLTEEDNETEDKEGDIQLMSKIKNCFNFFEKRKWFVSDAKFSIQNFNYQWSESKSSQVFNEAILELIYAVRCNMFHGKKGFQYEQKFLLKSLNEILLHIIQYVLDNK